METTLLGGPRPFPTTRWSLIRGARGPEGRAALEVLCRKYWGPVYFYVRRNWNKDVETAKDLAQEFFARLLERDDLAGVDPARGRFRAFVCASLRHFLLNRARHDAALKRAPVPPPGPDFDADWKRAVVEAAVERLRADDARLAELLVRYDLEGGASYGEVARELGMTVSQVTNGLHRARAAFREACLDEIRETTGDEEFEDEVRRLFGR
ncbi:MAG: sigma-70 family RNA polymerase sigma factor [Planctomycetes bacterium]|nr:sigma-70 family RNA polymerase sigma factor [Planctomycetota bacterium]